MECNKDEATRAREIAQKKFTEKDFIGAKKFALKAQNLYPDLEGIAQILATLDVYISAEKKMDGEANWYAILGVNPLADDESVRKRYRKLALMLHPDKNKSVGADGAFKLVSEAWNMLSDKAKRVAFDQKRHARVFQKVSTACKGSAAPLRANGVKNITKSTPPTVKVDKNTTPTWKGRPSAPVQSQKLKRDNFWTVCHGCMMQYEYLIAYLNHNLMCPNCNEPFLALETAPPPSYGSLSPIPWNFSQQRQNLNHHTANTSSCYPQINNTASPYIGSGRVNSPNSHSHTNFQWGPTAGTSPTAQAATVVQQVSGKVKREREGARLSTKREENLRRKHTPKRTGGISSTGYSNDAKRRRRRSIGGIGDKSSGKDITEHMDTETGGASKEALAGSNQDYSETGRVGITKPDTTRYVSQHEIKNLLMAKAKTEIRKKINDLNSSFVGKTIAGEDGDGNRNVNAQGESYLVNSVASYQKKSGANIDAENSETLTICVPDPDFHDFDKDRTERSFEENQVWSAYDDNGMPRYYAMIHRVICLNPFKMQISWLNSKSNIELGPLNWVGSGFVKTCGEFRIGKYKMNNSLNSFSHKVKWEKGSRGAIRIYPGAGDVWALYRNWSPDWNEFTADGVVHKYDMVEVLEDYNEELGVPVAPLVKVPGFKTVFHRHSDPRKVRRIPREEMFRFSHHVPSYLLTGHEAPNAPKGCHELDPAATPLELLEVIEEVKEDEFLVNGEKVKEEYLTSSLEKGNAQEVVDKTVIATDEEKGITQDTQEVETTMDAKNNTKYEIVDHHVEMSVG